MTKTKLGDILTEEMILDDDPITCRSFFCMEANSSDREERIYAASLATIEGDNFLAFYTASGVFYLTGVDINRLTDLLRSSERLAALNNL